MNFDQVLTLFLIWVGLVFLVAQEQALAIVSARAAKPHERALMVLLSPVVIVVGGLIDQVLWNRTMPMVFELPTIDLFTAILLGWLVLSLFRGVSPRHVRLVEPSFTWPRPK